MVNGKGEFAMVIFTKCAIIKMALLCRLERAPTFLVPIINPPFADNSRHFFLPLEKSRDRLLPQGKATFHALDE